MFPFRRTQLIFDLGVNHGEDTEYYLSKGFRVVGVEANPMLHAEVSQKLASFITRGRLVLLNVGVWSERKTLTFYRNLQNDHWSSFDPVYGCREGTPFEERSISCVTIDDLFRQHGTPYYLKTDIEGADRHVLTGMLSADQRPTYVSVEEYGVRAIQDLVALGYNKMKLAPQRTKSSVPTRKVEGRRVARSFTGYDSGPFGEELPGEWMAAEEFMRFFALNVRAASGEYLGPEHEWHDIHATVA